MADKMDKLKPCPFCGSEMDGLISGDFGHPDNSDCILSGYLFYKSEHEAWNRRHSE